MPYTGLPERTRALEYLQTRTAQSVIECGIRNAVAGHVTECSRSGAFINGVTRGTDGELATSHVELLSGREVRPFCSCVESEGGSVEWCEHTVALLLRACDLGFFSRNGGFESGDAGLLRRTSSPHDIALVVRELRQTDRPVQLEQRPREVETALILSFQDDRLGVQVRFDGAIQEPTLFGESSPRSARTLDAVLLDILDREGVWDEQERRWYVNSARGIELTLGLAREFEQVVSSEDLRPVKCAGDVLEANLTIEWRESGAELRMEWILPDGSRRPKERDLLGSGPFWVGLDNCIYPVSSTAARIASVFRGGAAITLLGSQLGPLLEALRDDFVESDYLRVVNPELQPASEIKAPTPVVELQRRDMTLDHFTSARRIEIEASLDFDYPAPPAKERLVYLPDRVKEKECADFLSSLGFEFQREQRRFVLAEDAALDFLSGKGIEFPSEWRVVGLDRTRKGIKLADLRVSVSLNAIGDGTSLERKQGRGKRETVDWFDCRVTLLLNSSSIPLSTIFKANLPDAARWLRLENGAFAPIPGGSLGQLKANLGMLDPNFRLTNTINTRISAAQAVGLTRGAASHFDIITDKWLRNISRKLNQFGGVEHINVSRNFHGKLRPYQADGLSWLWFLRTFEFGGILADEMGLGKTVQALALLQTAKDRAGKKGLKPTLIVAPTSVITNWWYEAKRFVPKLKVLLLHGPDRRSAFAKLASYDVIITSYALLRLDKAELEQHSFSYLILDEAQLIKNYQAATTLAAKSLKAEHRLALTGTPTENRPMELWSIMDFLMPGFLGSYDFFRSQIEKPILEGGADIQVAKALRLRTRPFIMRRCKSEVEKDLPPKIESVLHVEMTDSQRQLYSQVLMEVRPKVFDAIKKRGVAGASVSILAALLRLRQVCNHPNSIESLKELAGFESGKFNLFKDLLQEALENGRKLLVFCQFKEMLSIIRRHLEHSGVRYVYLDGATRERQPLIDRFNEDEKMRVFLISLKAGGLGLNLMAADTVVIYDPWWNPAVEAQAVDRAHRIGQKKTVYVYRMVTEDSVEQHIMALKKRKAQIVDALVNENGLTTLSLSKTDLEGLFADPKSLTEA